MPLKRDDWFPTSIWSIDLPEAEAMNAQLLQAVRAEHQRDARGMAGRSSILGWHSADNLHQRPEFREFLGHVERNALDIAAALRWDTRRARPVVVSCWAIINGKFASNALHTHANSMLSGVYYLQALPGSGAIYFRDPRVGPLVLGAPIAEFTPLTFTKITYRPIVGRLIFFPGWLDHGVEPNLSEGERICLSFNVGLQPAADVPPGRVGAY